MKTLFITHNNWNTIKQRSHFLAENLNTKKNDLTLVYKWSPRKFNFSKNNTKLKLIPCLFFPFSFLSIKILRDIDELIFGMYFKKIIQKEHFDHVIITHYLFYRFFKKIDNCNIIYDCHDDLELFYKKSKLKELIKNENINLLKKSDLNVFSSNNLLKKYGRYGKKNILVRNGHSLKIKVNNRKTNIKRFNIFYFGTISSWFDFSAIKIILKNFKNVRVTIIGPADVPKIKHKNIIYIKPMQHKELIKFSLNADAFIMPFKLSKLIYSVDPVKLYEYLIYGKPVISIFYPELKYFKKFIMFYKHNGNIVTLIRKILKNKFIKNTKLIGKFLSENTWKQRSKFLNEELQKMQTRGNNS